MKLHFTNDWLRNQIERDADIECDAGIPLRDAAPLERFVQAEPDGTQPSKEAAPERKMAVLHMLVHQVRRRDNLSIVQFAERIRVEAREVERIEEDPDYVPSPRTLHQVAEYMKVPARAMLSLTSDAIAENENVAKAAIKFAASSEDLSRLTRAERNGLNDFVKFLSNYDGEKS